MGKYGEQNIRKLGKDLYYDMRSKKFGDIQPTGNGGFFVQDISKAPSRAKKDKTPSYKKENEINKRIKRFYSIADDYQKEIFDIEKQKATERRIGGELSRKYRELEDLQAHKENIENDYRNSARKLEASRHRQDINNEFGISMKKEELNRIKEIGRIEKNQENFENAYLELNHNKGNLGKEIKYGEVKNKYQDLYGYNEMKNMEEHSRAVYNQGEKGKQMSEEYVKEGTPLKDMANQRVHDIEETLNNDKILLNYAKKKGLNGIDGTSIKELEDRIGQKQKYIRIAKGDDYLKEVDEKINKVEVPGFSDYEYDTKTGEVKIKDYDEKLNKVKEQIKEHESIPDENQDRYWQMEREMLYDKKNKLEQNDISPMSEYSDTTGTGLSDLQMANIEIKDNPKSVSKFQNSRDYAKETDKEERLKNVYTMDRVLRGMNNEDAIDDGWLMVGVEDEATDEGYGEFKKYNEGATAYTSDEDYNRIVNMYKRRVKEYAKDGVMDRDYYKSSSGNWKELAGLNKRELEFLSRDYPEFDVYGKGDSKYTYRRKNTNSKKETFTKEEVDTIKAKIDRYKKRKK